MSPPDADTSAGLSEVDLERSLKGERATSLSFPAGRPEPGTSSRASRVSPADPTPDSAPFPPASGVGDKAASSYAVPIVDLSDPDETAVADALWDAATTVGFFTVVGHGIDEESIDAQFEASREFFEQDLAVKEAASPFEPALNSGFEHMKQVRPSTGLPDVKESLQVTARADAMSGPMAPEARGVRGADQGVHDEISRARGEDPHLTRTEGVPRGTRARWPTRTRCGDRTGSAP